MASDFLSLHDAALLATRILLSAVFLVAGVAKLVDRDGTRRALVEFGVFEPLAGPFGWTLPWAELLAGFALLLVPGAWYGAVIALGLLAIFIAGIGINLARGRAPDCHCFGQLHSAPVGWSTLVRNIALAFLAAFVVWNGPAHVGPSTIAWIADLTLPQRLTAAGSAAALALLAMQGFLLVQILRQQGRLLLRLEALELGAPAAKAEALSRSTEAPPAGRPVGSHAPEFELDSLEGRRVAMRDLLSGGKPAMLYFTSPSCGACLALLPEVARWQRELTDLNIAIVSEGTASDNEAKASEHRLAQVLLQRKREVAVSFQVHGTPGAVLIRPDGTIGSPLAFGAEAIRALVARAPGSALRPPAVAPARGTNGSGAAPASVAFKPVALGDPAPPIKLAALDGETIGLPSLRGERTLLLFWNPACGFCQRMLSDLHAWEANPSPGAPRLVVISSGSPEENGAMRLRSLVLLDNDHRAAAAFGAHGTPMALLLDETARVVSGMAAGAPAVLALANDAAAIAAVHSPTREEGSKRANDHTAST